jgi:putative aminopeptidase FrvX
MGPSGFEDEIRQIIFEEIREHADRVYTDTMGNLIAEKDGRIDGPKVMICAHMDEVSLMIVHIEDTGMLRFRPIGGIDPRVLVSKPLRIGERKIHGVIGAKPYHLQSGKEREKPLAMDDLFIDIGATSRQDAEKYVKPGDVAVFATEYEEIAPRIAKAKSFDDRAGCAVMIETLKKSFDLPLAFVFTVQEEIGLRGAGPAAYAVNPDLAIVLESTVCFDAVDSVAHGQGTLLGKGPALTLIDSSTLANRSVLQAVVRTAEKNRIPYQFRRVSGGGNDAGRIHTIREGIAVGAISIPTRYIHSPAQIIHLDDYDHTVQLVEAFLRAIEKGEVQL